MAKEPIILSSCIVGAARWRVEQEVQEALLNHPIPSECPQGWLFVSPDVRSAVLQWGHPSKVACHPGGHKTHCLLCLCPWQDITPGTCWFPPSSAHTQLPLIVVDFVMGCHCLRVILRSFTIVDWFSKAVAFVRLTKLDSALETAHLLVTHAFRLLGIPQNIVSDHCPQFVSQPPGPPSTLGGVCP